MSLMEIENGYDRYLKFQFHVEGHFFTMLFEAISRADEDNLNKLALGFPEEVDAFKIWTRIGSGRLVAKCCSEYQSKVASGEWIL